MTSDQVADQGDRNDQRHKAIAIVLYQPRQFPSGFDVRVTTNSSTSSSLTVASPSI